MTSHMLISRSIRLFVQLNRKVSLEHLVDRNLSLSLVCSVLELIDRNPRQLVVVGDGACGKTSLLNVFVSGEFPEVSVRVLPRSRTIALTLVHS